MRGSILMSTCPREAYTGGYRKSINDAQYSFLNLRCLLHHHRPTIIMNRKIDSEQCGVGDSIRHTPNNDIRRCVLLAISCTTGQAGRFECNLCLGQEVLLPIWCNDVWAMLGRTSRIIARMSFYMHIDSDFTQRQWHVSDSEFTFSPYPFFTGHRK